MGSSPAAGGRVQVRIPFVVSVTVLVQKNERSVREHLGFIAEKLHEEVVLGCMVASYSEPEGLAVGRGPQKGAN